MLMFLFRFLYLAHMQSALVANTKSREKVQPMDAFSIICATIGGFLNYLLNQLA